MDIGKYVAELIQFHKEVGVDGFGTIYKKKSPGRYDSESRSFLPPGSTTAYKKEVTESNLLINHLVNQEGISRPAAADALSRYSLKLTQQLAEKGEADFPPIGTLRTLNGNTVLEQTADFNPGTEFFGLPKITDAVTENTKAAEPIFEQPVKEQPVNEQLVIEQTITEQPVVEQPVAERPVVVIPVTPVIPVTIPVVLPADEAPTASITPQTSMPEEVAREEEIVTDNLLEEENPGKETNEPMLAEVRKPYVENTIKYTIQEEKPKENGSLITKVALILAVILLLSIAFYYLYPRFSSSFTEKPTVTALSADQIKQDSLAQIAREKRMLDSAFKADSTRIAQSKATTPQITADTVSIASAVGDTTTSYEVIGASVLNEKEANWFIQTMKKNGIKAKVVHNIPGKRLKLSIATLKDEKSAKATRDRLSEKLKIKGLYIYKNKPE
jgi:hypothetical protein